MRRLAMSGALALAVLGVSWLGQGAAPPDTPKVTLLISFPSGSFTDEAFEAIRNCCSRTVARAVKACAAGEVCETVRLRETPLSGGWGEYTVIVEHSPKDGVYKQPYSGSDERLYHKAVLDKLQKAVTCHLFREHQIQPDSSADSDLCRQCGPPAKLPSDLLTVRKDQR